MTRRHGPPAGRVRGTLAYAAAMAEGAKYDWLLLGDAVDRAARMWGDRPAVVFGERRWNYSEFAAEVDRVAKGLMALGAQRGDHVAVWMTNLPEWLWLQYAIPKVGCCIVPLNTRYRTDDVAYTGGTVREPVHDLAGTVLARSTIARCCARRTPTSSRQGTSNDWCSPANHATTALRTP